MTHKGKKGFYASQGFKVVENKLFLLFKDGSVGLN